MDKKNFYNLDFNQFKIQNPEISSLPLDIQKMRWEYNNKLLKNSLISINQVILLYFI
jgi:hypothetical protein